MGRFEGEEEEEEDAKVSSLDGWHRWAWATPDLEWRC